MCGHVRQATPIIRLATEFRYTNGDFPHTVNSYGVKQFRNVIETHKGVISFGADDLCWSVNRTASRGSVTLP